MFPLSSWSVRLFVPVVLCVAVAGCAPTKAAVLVSDLASTFPTLQHLGVSFFAHREFNEGEPVCDALVYKRGAFGSIPGSDTCGTFDGSTAIPVVFDPQAVADLAAVRAQFDRIRVPMRYALIMSGPDGAVGAKSKFAVDGCLTYVYEPGWTSLPETFPGKEVVTGIDQNWYRVDICP